MQQHQLKGSLMLFFCALIWGLAFVAQSVGADHVGAFTFNGLRSLIGAVFLIPCVAFFDRLAGRPFSIWGTDNKTEQPGPYYRRHRLRYRADYRQYSAADRYRSYHCRQSRFYYYALYRYRAPFRAYCTQNRYQTAMAQRFYCRCRYVFYLHYRKFQRQLRRYDHFGLRLLFRTAYHHYRTFFRIGRRCADVAAAICRLRYFKSACHLLL